MKLNLRQIEVFRAIMLSGSISGASKLLYVSQPAVSRLISYTEQRLGLLLFQRIKGRLYPTPEARRLFEEVGAVYQSVQRVNEVAENLAENRVGQLRIACSPNIGQSLMPRAVASFCQRYPDVRIVLHTLIPGALLQGLLTHQVELGITFMPVGHPSLQVLPLYRNRIVAVLPKDHRLATHDCIDPSDLIDEPFVGYSSDIPFGQLVQQVFGSEDRQPVPRIEVQQAHVACSMVQAGVGVALVDEITMKGPIWSGVVARPITPEVHAPINVFRLELQPLSRLAQEFIAVLKSLGT
ncbi:LysR family transcriptional regulator [Cupriavidus basilensis OR16]|uniref:LysR family transcriptional regulator n=1 Tax=Cupriavidus basilensis OR16 TaxID=1127483 RepID=H1S3R0_9BURK|nr:LysR family transcriptional regulator [Cupriavidus basilensis]EHP42834.1 LysR family transcriptional regulator [Cupriavidus basilensis OR16]